NIVVPPLKTTPVSLKNRWHYLIWIIKSAYSNRN
ncbi:MAG: hypothetical protein ACI8P9_003586, partial [Parasphingorhabdus sp.]